MSRVKAFGLNRSELFTRQGHSPEVKFPRALGIEAVGRVAEAPVGLAAAMAKKLGSFVAATTRNPDREKLLRGKIVVLT